MIQTARLRIVYGELPRQLPELSLRTVSEGTTCLLCKRPIEQHSIEVQFPDPRTHKLFVMHPPCYSAWTIAVRSLTASTDETGTDVEEQPRPPSSSS
jgi:hypothetical protein